MQTSAPGVKGEAGWCLGQKCGNLILSPAHQYNGPKTRDLGKLEKNKINEPQGDGGWPCYFLAKHCLKIRPRLG